MSFSYMCSCILPKQPSSPSAGILAGSFVILFNWNQFSIITLKSVSLMLSTKNFWISFRTTSYVCFQQDKHYLKWSIVKSTKMREISLKLQISWNCLWVWAMGSSRQCEQHLNVCGWNYLSSKNIFFCLW